MIVMARNRRWHLINFYLDFNLTLPYCRFISEPLSTNKKNWVRVHRMFSWIWRKRLRNARLDPVDQVQLAAAHMRKTHLSILKVQIIFRLVSVLRWKIGRVLWLTVWRHNVKLHPRWRRPSRQYFVFRSSRAATSLRVSKKNIPFCFNQG